MMNSADQKVNPELKVARLFWKAVISSRRPHDWPCGKDQSTIKQGVSAPTTIPRRFHFEALG